MLIIFTLSLATDKLLNLENKTFSNYCNLKKVPYILNENEVASLKIITIFRCFLQIFTPLLDNLQV